MKRDIALSGFIGLLIGAVIFLAARWIKHYVPSLVSSFSGTAIVFTILLSLALAEMPMMLFALRRMVRSPTTPRGLVAGTNTGYVMFASIYASIFVLITGDDYYSLGSVLAALGLLRFASGVLIR